MGLARVSGWAESVTCTAPIKSPSHPGELSSASVPVPQEDGKPWRDHAARLSGTVQKLLCLLCRETSFPPIPPPISTCPASPTNPARALSLEDIRQILNLPTSRPLASATAPSWKCSMPPHPPCRVCPPRRGRRDHAAASSPCAGQGKQRPRGARGRACLHWIKLYQENTRPLLQTPQSGHALS